MSKKPWRVQTRGDHFVVLGSNGDEIATSKEYSSDATAREAAERFMASECSVEVREKHFVVKGTSGNVMLTSKQYASKSSATKSSERFMENIYADVVFEEGVDREGKPQVKAQRPSTPSAPDSPSKPARPVAGDINPPVPGVERHPQSIVYL